MFKKAASIALLSIALIAPTAYADSITGIVVGSDDFDTLEAAVIAAGLAGTLDTDGPFTVFAPTDDAFEALPNGVLDKLLMPSNQDLLVKLLTYHVVAGEVPSSVAITLREAETLAGEDLRLRFEDGVLRINNANVIDADIAADNGVIHVVDRVLLPKSFIGELNRR
jgi:uncharacterized surface protein with fasciclin (FAS1) repeats